MNSPGRIHCPDEWNICWTEIWRSS